MSTVSPRGPLAWPVHPFPASTYLSPREAQDVFYSALPTLGRERTADE
jgi:hypothetical protein